MLIARRSPEGHVEVVRLDPETCARNRAYKFRKRLLKQGIGWCGFWLFTFPAEAMDGLTKQEMHRRAMDAWKGLRARMWALGSRFRYVLVVEWTKAGRPHFHVLLDRYIPKAVVEKEWVAVGGGSFLKARAVREGSARGRKQAINYMVKYITKGKDRVAGCRRWAYTRGLLDKVEAKAQEWFKVLKHEVLALNLENDLVVDNGRGTWDWWPQGMVERGS